MARTLDRIHVYLKSRSKFPMRIQLLTWRSPFLPRYVSADTYTSFRFHFRLPPAHSQQGRLISWHTCMRMCVHAIVSVKARLYRQGEFGTQGTQSLRYCLDLTQRATKPSIEGLLDSGWLCLVWDNSLVCSWLICLDTSIVWVCLDFAFDCVCVRCMELH